MRIHVLILIIIQENFKKERKYYLQLGNLSRDRSVIKTSELPLAHAYKTFIESIFNMYVYVYMKSSIKSMIENLSKFQYVDHVKATLIQC